MTIDDTTKRAAVRLLLRGLITQSEAARLAGVSRQAVAQWLKGQPTDTREKHIAALWQKAISRRK